MSTDTLDLNGVLRREVFTPACPCHHFDETDVFDAAGEAQEALDEHQLQCSIDYIRHSAETRQNRIADEIATTRIVTTIASTPAPPVGSSESLPASRVTPAAGEAQVAAPETLELSAIGTPQTPAPDGHLSPAPVFAAGGVGGLRSGLVPDRQIESGATSSSAPDETREGTAAPREFAGPQHT